MLARRIFIAAIAGVLALLGTSCATIGTGGEAVDQRVVTIAMPDGSADALLFHPAGKGSWPAVLVWTDSCGLRPAYAEIGRKLAAEGYVVLIPNAFYRSVNLDGSTPAPALPAEQARERGTQWRAAASEQAVMRDTRAYITFLDTQPMTAAGAKAGTLGFDYGAANAFYAARALPDRIGAVAALYPSGTATPRPNSPHLFVSQSMAAYYIAIARNDDAREPGDKDDYRKAFDAAGLDASVEVLPADHGFALADDAAFDPAASEAAWAKVLALFGNRLAR